MHICTVYKAHMLRDLWSTSSASKAMALRLFANISVVVVVIGKLLYCAEMPIRLGYCKSLSEFGWLPCNVHIEMGR